MTHFIKKEDLNSWLSELVRKHTVIAPVAANGAFLFLPVDRG